MIDKKHVLGCGILICLMLLISFQEVSAQCSSPPVVNAAYRTFVHNSGYFNNCVQDYDLDIPESSAFKTSFAGYFASAQRPVIGDWFDYDNSICIPLGKDPHGVVVERYVNCMSSLSADIVDNSYYTLPWDSLVIYITEQYSNSGRVVNLSTGMSYNPGWDMGEIEAICAAYDSGLVLSGPHPVWIDDPNYGGLEEYGDKVLLSMPMNSMGELLRYHPDPDWVNACYIGVPTNWQSDTKANLALQGTSVLSGLTMGYVDEGISGSYTSGLLSGSMQYIADVVYERGYRNGEFTQKVLDYVLSSCDRIDDPESYAFHEHEIGVFLHSYAPWSPTWGYGVYSAWKALVYAYGFGILEAKDSELDPGNLNPPTVFSDHFLLRGDLLVPADQAFRVSELASINIDPDASTPEGPTDLGLYPTLHEIRVAGGMEIVTSIENGVNATVVIDPSGSCTVEDGGLITIGSGQILHVMTGGELNLEQGGQIIVMDGGKVVMKGDFNIAGQLTMLPGSTLELWDEAQLYLEADLMIPENVVFSANTYPPYSLSAAEIIVAAEDVSSSGADPDRVEIVCEGRMVFCTSNPQFPIVIKGEEAGSDTWAGIVLDSDNTTASLFSAVEISDAVIGLDISGSNFTVLMNMDYSECGTGLRLFGKLGYQVLITGGKATACTTGIKLWHSDVNLTGMWINGNEKGVICNGSSPKVRDCHIYDNDIGIHILDGLSIPDLGTISDSGENDFHGTDPAYPGLANDIHIYATNPISDIYAQNNWWGTTVSSLIEARITVEYLPPVGTGVVVYVPVLTALQGILPDPDAGAIKDDPKRPMHSEGDEIPKANYLSQNYPNPFNPVTTIVFGLEKAGQVDLQIYDASGRLVKTLLGEMKSAGRHEEVWNGTDNLGNQVANGVYFYRLKAADFMQTRKMILLR